MISKLQYFGLLLALASPASAEISFNRDIRPIMADTCFNCHGADEGSRKAKLRLDIAENAYQKRDGITAIIPGNIQDSDVVRRLFSDDEDEVMPPTDHPHQLTAAQKETVKQWIKEGAKYEGHWAFRAPVKSKLSEKPTWARNEIDQYVYRNLISNGQSPQHEADKATLVRRLALDLTGLPPSPEELQRFLTDNSDDAYEKLVDRLLASPHYGERMAMWWLDGARYADSHGFQADWERYQWPWRDWVIGAFNTNKPFDQFTIEQLAGDLLPNPTNSQIVATGFNRNHRINTEGGSLNEEWHVENVIDRVETTGSVWMGLTFNCCRCHDHKYDPISQKEFYQFYAFFNNVPERGVGPGKQGNFAPVVNVHSPEHTKQLADLRKQLATAQQKLTNDRQLALANLTSASIKRQKTTWAIITAPIPSSRTGAEFEKLADGSYRVRGKKSPKDTHTMVIATGDQPVTAMMLEAIPDKSFVNKGFTRGTNGNFVLSGVRASVIETGKPPVPIKLVKPKASYEQKGWPIANALNGKSSNGWAVSGNTLRISRQAIFEFAKPLLLKSGQQLQLSLGYEALEHHILGRFRISLTRSKKPTLGKNPIAPDTIAALGTPNAQRSTAQIKLLQTYLNQNPKLVNTPSQKAVTQLSKQISTQEKQNQTVMVMSEMAKPRAAHILERGEYDKKGALVTAGLPAVLPALPPGEKINRLGMARWLVSGQHPLTARVQVNRIWENLFGVGFVKTSENFGTQADWPSHPELLDWLAVEFVENGWDVKKLIKFIVTSSTYRQSSQIDAARLEKDPENRLISRGPRFRVQAEVIRDQALAISGLLNPRLGGPSVRPYQPAGIWSETNFYGNLRNYKNDTDGNQYRRSLYTIWKRTAAPPGMTLFDMPNREICTVKRSRTNTPLQALALLNEITYLEASRMLAAQSMGSGKTADTWIKHAFVRATSRQVTAHELAVLQRGYDRRLMEFKKTPNNADQLLKQGLAPLDPKLPRPELAALTTVVSIILNLDEVITKE